MNAKPLQKDIVSFTHETCIRQLWRFTHIARYLMVISGCKGVQLHSLFILAVQCVNHVPPCRVIGHL